MKFYAGYNNILTDVAMFNSEKERDEWVDDEYSPFTRIALSEDEAYEIVGSGYDLHNDELDDRTIWLINTYNVIPARMAI